MIHARLAPLCGVTDYVFREICFEQGCEQACTEMISAMGYLCSPGQRATQKLMIRGKKEKKLIVQLFGRDPDTVAEAAARMEALERWITRVETGSPSSSSQPGTLTLSISKFSGFCRSASLFLVWFSVT